MRAPLHGELRRADGRAKIREAEADRRKERKRQRQRQRERAREILSRACEGEAPPAKGQARIHAPAASFCRPARATRERGRGEEGWRRRRRYEGRGALNCEVK